MSAARFNDVLKELRDLRRMVGEDLRRCQDEAAMRHQAHEDETTNPGITPKAG